MLGPVDIPRERRGDRDAVVKTPLAAPSATLSGMASGEYLGQASLTVSILPARAVYLIRQGSRPGFRRAVQEACTRSAGMTEPIVPVRKGGSIDRWWCQVVGLARIDAAVNVDVEPGDAQAAATKLGVPLVGLKDLEHWGPASWTCHTTGVVPRPWVGQAAAIACENAPLWQVAAAGDLTSEYEADFATNGLPVRRPRSEDELVRAGLSAGTLIDLTVSHFAERWASPAPSPTPAVLWVAPLNGLPDCLMFWNLRALRPMRFERVPIMLLPERGTEHWVGFDRQIPAVLARVDEFAPDVLVCSEGVAEERLNEIALGLGLTPSNETFHSRRRWPPLGMRSAPFTYLAPAEPRSFFVFERRYGATAQVMTQLFREETVLSFASPVPFSSPNGMTMMRIEGGPLDALPRRASVARLIHQNAAWGDGALQINTDTRPEYVMTIRSPAVSEAVDAVLRDTAPGYQMSDKGLLAQAIERQIDLDQLLRPGAYEAIRALTTPRSKELLRALRESGPRSGDAKLFEIAAKWGSGRERANWSANDLKGKGVNGAAQVVEGLVASGLVDRGLKLPCGRCLVKSFVPFSEVNSNATCPGCRSDEAYALAATGPTVYYQLNSFIDRASDQGVLPPLLVWAALRRLDPATHILPGVNVQIGGGPPAEVDIFGIHGAKVVAGEVKTSAKDFTPTQIRRDVALSSSVGADVHVLATVETVPDATAAFVRKEAGRARLGVLMLGQDELRPPA